MGGVEVIIGDKDQGAAPVFEPMLLIRKIADVDKPVLLPAQVPLPTTATNTVRDLSIFGKVPVRR